MSILNDEDESGIRWGSPAKQGSDKDTTFYSSFFSKEGVEYMLYDNVKVSNDSGDPYIGKIIKLWQEESIGVKKALIHWFFKSNELPTEPGADPREVFLAFGKGKGVTNENEVEVICGKCTVVCSSKDIRNRQPSESDIKNADFFFSQIYDVDLNQFRPIDEVVDKLGCGVVYNKEEWITSVNASNDAPKVIEKSEHDAIAKHISHLKRPRNSEGSDEAHPNAKHHQSCFEKLTISSTAIDASANVDGIQKNEMILSLPEPIKVGDTKPVITNVKNESNGAPKSLKTSKNNAIPKQTSRLKKIRDSEVSDEEQLYANKNVKIPSTPTEAPVKYDDFKKTKKVSPLPEPSKDDNSVNVYKEMQNKEKKLKISTCFEIEKKSQTNDVAKTFEKRTILKDLTWEEKLEQNIKLEKVLLLENLDPLVTSADVEEMLKNIFQGISGAKVLPHEKDFPYGKALAIFESRSFADAALEEMEQKCLVMTYHKRTIIASKVEVPVNFSAFLGHLALDKLRLNKNHQSEDYKNAMYTSHCSQPNTIEYEMAMEWRQLEEIMQTCTNELFKKQRKEMEILMRSKKS